MFPIFLPSARPPFGTIEDRLSYFIRFEARLGVCMNKALALLKQLRVLTKNRLRNHFSSTMKNNGRASYNGSIEASQASDVGSIPIARSINYVYGPKTSFTERSGDIVYTLGPKGFFKGCRVFSSRSM